MFQISFDSSVDVEDNSSGASTPNETTPSLSQRRQPTVRQDLCANCIAAAAVATLVNTEDDTTQSAKGNFHSDDLTTNVQQVLSPEKVQVTLSAASDNKEGSKTMH